MSSNPIPLPRPDPEVQTLKLEVVAIQSRVVRLFLRSSINEELATSNTQFSNMICWALMGLMFASILGGFSLIFTAIGVYCCFKSAAARKRARDLSERLAKLE